MWYGLDLDVLKTSLVYSMWFHNKIVCVLGTGMDCMILGGIIFVVQNISKHKWYGLQCKTNTPKHKWNGLQNNLSNIPCTSIQDHVCSF